ncbi:GNAT family N-acetyltransferase [Chondrinema litorale]|uniref:GNAT family N-acetyltransferase n=1 Tax=Chondrinema litorale TaxID=2994555 RepID=UPI00254354FC|nr:GNAT family N-acetyltransferase [Chondrinema litorale]UZR97927.1 GNAT family N-acetyltransferase [Chondrinema litorale]
MMDLIKENKDNLTALWKLAGKKANAFHTNNKFDLVSVNYSEWPNRLWFHEAITEESLNTAMSNFIDAPSKLIVPYWNIYKSKTEQLLVNQGFKVQFGQVGMSLKLEKPFDFQPHLKLKIVEHESSAELWSKLFKSAFNYLIHPKLLMLCKEEINFFIAYAKDQPVGTAALFSNNKKVVGIHSVGVIPEMRRKGYAEDIMLQLLNLSIESKYEYTTLQASVMGKGLYLKLGFVEQFEIRNYVYNPN